MKAAILVGLARQVEGEFCFVNVIKASTDPAKLQKHLDQADLPRTGEFGGVNCVVEYGIITDIEVETD